MTARPWVTKKTLKWLIFVASAAVLLAQTVPAGSRRTTFPLLEGTRLEIEGCTIEGRADGPSIYLVAGLHGDETAGWMAAGRLRELRLSAGKLWIVSPANRYGAAEGKRKTAEERDINRNFPGDRDGCDAERIAAALYEDIEKKKPDLVLDLHEAETENGSKDDLGNSLICLSIETTGDLVLDLMTASQQGQIGSGPLTLYGSPPPGSINRVVTEALGIPVITVETSREEPLERRIENHLEIVGYILDYYGLP